jgi:hypothetical protein
VIDLEECLKQKKKNPWKKEKEKLFSPLFIQDLTVKMAVELL